MIFRNEKFKKIFGFAYYGVFLLAALIIFIIGCADMDKANQNDLMSLLICIVVLASPGLLFLSYLKKDSTDKGVVKKTIKGTLSFLLSIATNFIIYGGTILLVFLSEIGSGTGEQIYRTLCVSTVISTIISLTMYSLLKNLNEDEEILRDVVLILAFVSPFVSYLIAFILLKFFSLVITFMIIGSVFISLLVFILNESAIGTIAGGGTAIAIILSSIIMGAMQKDCGLNYSKNTLDLLVFLPILTTIYTVCFWVSQDKREIDNSIYLIISRVIAYISLPFVQYLVGIKWYIGLGIYFGLLIVIMIVDLFFRPKELVEKKIKESKERLGLSAKGGLEEQLENMLGNHMSGYDHAEVRITGSSTAQINVTIYYRHEVHSRQNWYRNDVMHWIKSYLNSHNTGYNSYEIHVNFSNNF